MAIDISPPRPEHIDRDGDTMTGGLIINTTGSADAAGLPLGRAGARQNGLAILSSFAGGEDEGQPGTADTTGRLYLYSHQRADVGSFGEVIRIFPMRNNAKAMMAWYLPKNLYAVDGAPNAGGWDPVWWMGVHYDANDGGAPHGHFSFERVKTNGGLYTVLEHKIFDPSNPTEYMDRGNWQTNESDWTVRTHYGHVLRLASGGGSNRDIEFSNDAEGSQTAVRWRLRVDSTAEAGDVGSDFRILRRAGGFEQTALFIERQNGNVGIGRTSTGARLDIASDGAYHGVRVETSASPGVNAALAVTAFGSGDRVIDARAAGDTTARVVIFADGRIEFGSGNAARDTVLYRSAADTLKTDDALSVGGVLSVDGNIITPTGALAVGVGSPGGTAHVQRANDGVAILARNTAAGGNNSACIVAEAQTVGSRLIQGGLQSDAVKRLSITGDGKVEWGDGAAARDTNLYRSAAATLRTDHSLHVGATFRHLGSSLGFFNAAAVAKPTVTGSRGGNAALASVLSALAQLGLLTDSTTA